MYRYVTSAGGATLASRDTQLSLRGVGKRTSQWRPSAATAARLATGVALLLPLLLGPLGAFLSFFLVRMT